MNHSEKNTVNILQKADALVDWFSVNRMNLVTVLSRHILPRGFWGDGHSKNSAQHPESSDSRVYLTFDDGPSPDTTPYLLELLEANGVKASFFLIGTEAERYPELVEQIHKGGHSIGNHSYKHQFMPILAGKQLEHEIQKTNDIIKEITGEAPAFFRPPFGIMCKRTASLLNEREMHPVYWSQAPEDWAIPGAHRVVRRIMMGLNPGSLIVLHEGESLKSQTLVAAKEIIYRCKSADLQLEKVLLSA